MNTRREGGGQRKTMQRRRFRKIQERATTIFISMPIGKAMPRLEVRRRIALMNDGLL